MLLITSIFERTWGQRAGSRLETEYWQEVIQAVRTKNPGVLFMAEAYWDLESTLQQQGFNYCYDKRLYDRLAHENASSVRLHLLADLAYQEKLVRFIENHDEPRAAATFSPGKERAAAVTIMTLPGAKLLHEGQFEGCRVKLPVQLGRRPLEPADAELRSFYLKLVQEVSGKTFREGEWQLCDCSGWPDNQSWVNLVSWCWRKGKERCLIVVNLSAASAQGIILISWDDLAGRVWRLTDRFSGAVYERDGDEMQRTGLFVDLHAWSFHFMKLQ